MRYSIWSRLPCGFLFLLQFCIASSALAGAGVPTASESRQVIVATINGQPVFAHQLDPLVEARARKFRNMGVSPPEKEARQLFAQQALETLIEEELLHQAGRRLAAATATTEADTAEVRPDSPLPAHDPEEHRRHIDLYLTTSSLLNPLVPEEKVRQAYDNTKAGFTVPETTAIRQILIRVDENSTPERWEEASRKIAEAREQLEAGQSFSAVAARFSDCNSASWGGELGPFERGYMPSEIDEVAFSLSPGTLSEVIKTTFGLHMLEVLSRTPGGPTPYEDVRDLLARRIQKEMAAAAIKSHLEELKREARIEIFL